MFKANQFYKQLNEQYLFSTIATKVRSFQNSNPNVKIISLGIGDVTLPVCNAVVKAMQECALTIGTKNGFVGYGPEQGHLFLREAIRLHDYCNRGIELSADEIFISDGAKSDIANMTDLISRDCIVGITNPVYPVYLDTNMMDGRRLVFLPCKAENYFNPVIPRDGDIDVIYLCSPNNPTGTAMTKEVLAEWVNYARKNGSLILFDAAYEAYVTEPNVPRSIYEVPGAKECAIEFRSFSKTAGFTGLRCGYTIVPLELKDSKGLNINKMWKRRQSTKFNGASYIVQRGAEALYTQSGREQVRENIAYYQHNADNLLKGLKQVGITAYGGVNSPYIWLQTPDKIDSWQFFDILLNECAIVSTPGVGFGTCGEGFMRLTSFNTHENTSEAILRINRLFNK